MKASPEEEGEAAAAREPDGRCGRSEAEAERLRTRERLEATLAGLAELEFLRQRQELRVRRLLLGASPAAAAAASSSPPPGDGAAGPAPRSLEEKFLEENILLLRRQLDNNSSFYKILINYCSDRRDNSGFALHKPSAENGKDEGTLVVWFSVHPERKSFLGDRTEKRPNWGKNRFAE
ncbi:UNVERIFIED_CONTAM: hypothetical protein K2H54_015685 [Gekko kuhli]